MKKILRFSLIPLFVFGIIMLVTFTFELLSARSDWQVLLGVGISAIFIASIYLTLKSIINNAI